MEQPVEILNLAMVQYDMAWENSSENLKHLDDLFKSIETPVDVIVLPEAFNSGFSMDAPRNAEGMNGKTVEWMLQKASQMKCAICGSLFIEENGNFYNRLVWANTNEPLLSYDKRHLFSFEGEADNYTRGRQRVIIEYNGWKILPQICYDLRFPVWSRNNLDYDLMLNVANWPSSRQDVWLTLLKARALENQSYVVGVNRVGSDGMNIEYAGDSIAFNAKGQVIKEARNTETVTIVPLSYSELHGFREKFNVLKDRDSFLISF